MTEGNALPGLSDTGLLRLLVVKRRQAMSKWPYTHDRECRRIEAEIRSRGLVLPEDVETSEPQSNG